VNRQEFGDETVVVCLQALSRHPFGDHKNVSHDC